MESRYVRRILSLSLSLADLLVLVRELDRGSRSGFFLFTVALCQICGEFVHVRVGLQTYSTIYPNSICVQILRRTHVQKEEYVERNVMPDGGERTHPPDTSERKNGSRVSVLIIKMAPSARLIPGPDELAERI